MRTLKRTTATSGTMFSGAPPSMRATLSVTPSRRPFSASSAAATRAAAATAPRPAAKSRPACAARPRTTRWRAPEPLRAEASVPSPSIAGSKVRCR